MESLDAYRNRFPRPKGYSHREYEIESKRNWIRQNINSLRCRTDLDEVCEALIDMLEAMNEDK